MASLGLLHFSRGFSGPAALSRLVGELEDEGIDHFFMTEGGNEAMTALAGFAAATRRATIGSAIVNIYWRHPYELAMAAGNVDDLAGGRLVLGLGTGHQVSNVDGLGLDMSKPLGRMTEYLAAVRATLEAVGQPIQFTGERYRITGPRNVWVRTRRLPIILAALSDGMVRLAGRSAEGIVTSLAPAPQLREFRKLLDDSAREAGRDPAGLTIYAIFNTVLRPTREEAREVVRPSVAGYARLPFYQRELARNNLSVADGQVSDETVDALALAGPAEYLRERLAELREIPGLVPILAASPGEADQAEAYRGLARLARD